MLLAATATQEIFEAAARLLHSLAQRMGTGHHEGEGGRCVARIQAPVPPALELGSLLLSPIPVLVLARLFLRCHLAHPLTSSRGPGPGECAPPAGPLLYPTPTLYSNY